MKEIIVVENKAFLNKTDFVCIEDIVKDLKVEYKKEQVPETFTELIELCKNIKTKLNNEIWELKLEDEFIYIRRKWETKEICFTSVGNMVGNNGWDLLMTNLTPARQWQIIKNLIGE